MHVLLVYANPPSLTFGFMPGPYGLELLRTYIEELPVECDIVNPFLSLEPEVSLARALRPDTTLIGVSVRNLDDALVRWSTDPGEVIQTRSCIEEVRSLIASCRRLAPSVPVLLGGAAFAHMPGPLLEYLGGDAGLSGMPEEEFAEITHRIAVQGQSLGEALTGISAAVVPKRTLGLRPKVRSAPLVARRPVVRRERMYFRFRREAAVRSFTGCPLRCSHCVEHLASRSVERSAVELVADEVMGILGAYPEVERVFLADSEVNLVGEARTRALVGSIRERAEGRPLALAGYFNPRPMSFGLLSALAKARCDVRLTVDHLADAVLERNGKNFRQRDIERLVQYHRALGLELSFCLLLGQPGETLATLEEVFRFIERIPDAIRGPIYFSPGVRVYPGTPLDRELRQGALDRRRLIGPGIAAAPGADLPPFVQPVVYCEPYDPPALFDYVRARMGMAMVPMNGYLADLQPAQAQAFDRELRAYHVGMAQLETDESESLAALARVSHDAPFLGFRERTELLWTRGRLALACGNAGSALSDWTLLLAGLTAQQARGPGLARLEHNISIARALSAV
jgi:radical SAM superfamily enzyme YgiQ (UPF0313 family)